VGSSASGLHENGSSSICSGGSSSICSGFWMKSARLKGKVPGVGTRKKNLAGGDGININYIKINNLTEIIILRI
jgi:hypothetical protein